MPMMTRCATAALFLLAAACSEPSSPFQFFDSRTDTGGSGAADAGAVRDDDGGDDGDTSFDDADAGGATDSARDVEPADGRADATESDADPPDTDRPDAADTDVAPPDTRPPDARPDVSDGWVVDAVPAGARSVAIATFNVARFFDTTCDSGRCGADDFEYQPSQAQYDYRAFQIAEGIRMLDVDVVLVQEVETLDCLETLAEQLGREWSAYTLGEMGFDASLDVGVLSTWPITSVDTYRDRIPVERPDGSTTTFSREFLEVELSVDGAPVLVFTSHFKSKNNDDPGRRFGEAAAARDIVLSRAAGRRDALVVFGGDLNDTPGSDPINELERFGGMVRVGELLGDRDGTITYRGERQAIDHLYLATENEARVVADSVRVVRDASGNLGGSDHAALRAEFVLP